MNRFNFGLALTVSVLTMTTTLSWAAAPAPTERPAVTPPPAAVQTPPELAPRFDRVAARIASIDAQAERLSDYDQLRNLQQIFGYYFDKALWSEVADLFAADATLEVGNHGEFIGRARILQYLRGLRGPGFTPNQQGIGHGQLNNHFQLSPVISLSADGQRAQARWRLMLQEGQFNVSAHWGAGIYENEYFKEGGIWKIARLRLYVKFYAPYEGGWTRATAQGNEVYGASSARPTRPVRQRLATWPAGFSAAPHFENPARAAYRLAPENSVAAASIANTPNAAPRNATELEAKVRALELKLTRLKAATEAERLENIYGYYADKSMQDAISALFARDSTLEILGRGVFVGRDRVYEYMRRLGAPTHGLLFNHMQLQPVVTVSPDGNSASIRARLLVMFSQLNTRAEWGDGVYENRFLKEDGVWKYQSLSGYQTFYSNYDLGWGKHSSPMLSYFPGYPPDLPQSVNYKPYPEAFIPPFHYKHPVTGR